MSEEEWARFKEVVVSVAKPVLKVGYDRGDVSKEVFKQVVKKTAEKVVGGYRKEGLTPPTAEDLAPSQRAKIEKLTNEYLALYQKQ